MQLADDPADARGLLSYRAGLEVGTYGYLVRGEIQFQGAPDFVPDLRRDPTVRLILEVPEGDDANGLSVYGAGTGRYPLGPTLIFETERDITW